MWKFKFYSIALVFIMFGTSSIDLVNYMCKSKTTIAILEEENHNNENVKKLISEKYLIQNLQKPVIGFSLDKAQMDVGYFSNPQGINYVYVIDFPPENLL